MNANGSTNAGSVHLANQSAETGQLSQVNISTTILSTTAATRAPLRHDNSTCSTKVPRSSEPASPRDENHSVAVIRAKAKSAHSANTITKVSIPHHYSASSTMVPRNPGIAEMKVENHSTETSQVNIPIAHSSNATTKALAGREVSMLTTQVPRNPGPTKINLRAINSYAQVESWLRYLPSIYPFVEIRDLGRTFENRSIFVVKIAREDSQALNRSLNGAEGPTKAIFLDGGTHSREQITVTVALSLIDKLVKAHEKNESSPWAKVSWYIVPLVNPDGYEYSRTPKGRQWRKNRSRSSSGCLGVDVNRNWNFHWGMESDREGKKNGEPSRTGFFSTVSWFFTRLLRPDNIVRQLSLLEPCTELYAGPSPFSEAESKLLSDFLVDLANQRNVTLWSAWSLHSMIGGQQLLFPYGYTTKPVPHYDHLSRLASNMAAAMEAPNGRKYQHGSVAGTLCR
ncbi:hypothetical protein RvY_14453-2 [Ramazzottius varieornatus]|uniref:Peptidase M14 domain-containing protein n=1 Tax=Ramazzottius varieornatus TaxID=947166 RepID=A0A1D1VTC7_RAMVA|nr:hypothetical protein RvY_14453-2 [Ramazzottius varieornatus]